MLLHDLGDPYQRAGSLHQIAGNPDRLVHADHLDPDPFRPWADAGDCGPCPLRQDRDGFELHARTRPGKDGPRLDEHGRLRRNLWRSYPSDTDQGTFHLRHVAVEPDQ